MRHVGAVLGFTTLLGTLVSVHLWQQLREANDAVESLRGQVTALQAVRHGLPSIGGVPGGEAPSTSDRLQPELQQPAQSSAESTSPQGAAPGRRIVVGSMEMLKDPGYRQSMATSIRASLPQRYPYLAEELSLSPEQLGRLYDRLTNNQLALMETIPPAGAPAEVIAQGNSSRGALSRQHDADLASELGATTYALWKDYNETLGVRQQVGRLDVALQSSARPLGEVQRKQLMAALVVQQKQSNLEALQVPQPADSISDEEKTAIVAERMRIEQGNNQRLLEAAATILSPEQLDTFRKMQDQAAGFSRALLDSR